MQWKRLRRGLAGLILLGVVAGGVFLAVLAVRAERLVSKQLTVIPLEPTAFPVDEVAAAARLVRLLELHTVAAADPEQLEPQPFEVLHQRLTELYPRVHATLSREVLGTPPLSLLYTWQGTDPRRPAVLLMSHLDVVPVDRRTVDDWDHDPLAPALAHGAVWGRGALDVKCGVAGILEAVEGLLGEGFQPQCTVYLAFGHDEEVGGMHGNRQIAARLKERAVNLDFVLDEGGAILEGIVPGVARPVALVAVAEKRIASLQLVARGAGGHGSLPARDTAIARLARALERVLDRPMPARLEGGTSLFLDFLAPEMSFDMRLVMANRWCLEPLVLKALAAAPATEAVVRTTLMVTRLDAGQADNQVPTRATANLDVRLLPEQQVEQVLEHLQRVIADPQVACQLLHESAERPPVASVTSRSFLTLQRTIQEVCPDVVVAPGQTSVTTDSRHYAELTRDIYRFMPLRFQREDLPRLHGINERIRAANHIEVIRFFGQLLKNACGP